MRSLIPRQLALDIFDGQCWVGVVPFWMSAVRARGTPAMGGWSLFPELNVRTYVVRDGKPGVYFFSLDAASLVAVRMARALYRLPYFHANMKAEDHGGEIAYSSVRKGGSAEFRGSYGPRSAVGLRRPGSLEQWLSERYCLYTVHRETLYRGEIHHAPWPLQEASAEIDVNTMASCAGIVLPDTKPLLLFAKRLDVLIWPLKRAG